VKGNIKAGDDASRGRGVSPLFVFPFDVPAIALHYLSTLSALSRARVPVRFDLRRRREVTVQEEVERSDALRQHSR
jgi:hypothetical protein